MAERKYYRKIYRRNEKKAKLLFIYKFLIFGFLFSVFSLLVIFILYAKDLPRPEKFTERHFIQSTKIYDRTGEVLLYEIYGEEKRTVVSLSEIPEHLRQAVIVAEDFNFYQHFGVDFGGILRSVLINLRIGEPIYGGSTIPQQLIRSTFFSTEKTIERKVREIVLALEIDRRYSKDQILEWYLNQVPFGSNCYGAGAASLTYFQKPISEVSLAEAATLAAVIQAPSYLSPYGEHKDQLLSRKNDVLERMAEKGFLSEEEAKMAKEEEVKFAESPVQIKAPYFTLWVKQEITNKYGEDFLKEKGLKVYTSLDWELQKIAEEATREGVERNRGYNAHNAGLVAIDPKTGEVLAMTVGTGDYFAPAYPEDCASGCLFDPKFNVVIGTESSPGRQPGSSFKPFVYAAAFERGSTATTTVIDEETNFGLWGDEEYIPRNYDGLYRGEMTLRDALAQSINIASVKVLVDLCGPSPQESINNAVRTAQGLGITTLVPPYGPSIVLGGWEVKLLDMVSAYGVFAAQGLQTSPVSILRIEDQQGNILEENKKTQKRVLSRETASAINDILSDNVARAPMFGAFSPLYFPGYQVAAKTGTTQNFRDAWTIGYSSSIAVGVWVGNSNNEAMAEKPGVVLAGPIFHSFMEKALLEYPEGDL